MTNIGITTFGCDGGRSGIGRYTVNLIRGLANLKTSADFHLYMFRDEENVFGADAVNFGADLFPSWLKRPVVNIAWHQTRLARWCRQKQHKVLFLPAGNRRLPLHSPCPTVGTVHDFSSLHVQGKYDAARMFYIKQVLPFLTRQLTHILTVSESSKRDIVEFANVPQERVTVTPLAVDHQRFGGDVDQDYVRIALKSKYEIERPYLLYVSRIEHPGKNHVRLIEAFNQVKAKEGIPHQLVLAGSDWSGADAVHQIAAQSPFASDIKFTGFVGDDELIGFYKCADLLVFPSSYEGFGLPVLEAMACGVPVACSNTSSLPEVGGDAAVYFSPDESESIAEALTTVMSDEELRQSIKRRGLQRSRLFTWEETARKTFSTLIKAAQLEQR